MQSFFSLAMSTRSFLALLILGGLTLSLGCNSGRSTALLTRIDRTLGSSNNEWEYRYNDSNQLEELQIESGAAQERWEITYNDAGQVIELRQEVDGQDDLIYDFEYEDGRLVEKRERQGSGYNADSDLSYDSNGRLLSVLKDVHIGDNTTIVYTHTLDLDDQGRIEQWEEVRRTTIDVPIFGTAETTRTFEREFRYTDEGQLEEIRISDAEDNNVNNSDVEYEYDDQGRLAELFDERGDRANLDYDDQGRIEEVDFTDVDDRYSFSYGESSSSGIGLEPIGVPYATFFDVEGQSFSGFDANGLTFLLGL